MVPGENSQIVSNEDIWNTSSTSVADEARATCIVRDKSNGWWDNEKQVIVLPIYAPASLLMKVVGNKFAYHPDTFELIYQRISDNETVLVNECGDTTLEEMGFLSGETKRNNLVIGDKNSVPPTRIEKKLAVERFEHSKSWKKIKEAGDAASTYVPPPAPPPYTSEVSDYSYSYSSALMRQETGFVGLVNQAMTCYLNSLLQTLFMTPEFRNALYRWEYDGTEEEGSKSIPFQLQKLFLQLQTSKKPAVGTTELTTSFGWDSSEAWQQHDVQELCRVMFDALEQKFKNTEQADLISRLYEGKLKDYVKCLECSYESAREDTFLDVPLVVRPFGSSQAYSSVEEALHAFVTPEILQGSNQYFCEQCNKKCNAHKGLKFIKFPYLLTLQLKRFDFDPVTMHRIKLNDRVSFPEILYLNEFIKNENYQEACDDGDTTDSGSALDDEGIGNASGYKTCSSLSPEAMSDNIDLGDDDEGIDVGPHGPLDNSHESCVNERNLKKSMEKGPYVYELFSIMVHSGSANGGHYYAYIKSFKHGEWYCFNDAQVTRITYDDIQKTYGGGPTRGYYSSAYSSSTNAYMLMYRQIDKDKNAECMTPEEFPEHIKELLDNMQKQEERERQQRELERSMCKIKLFCQHPTQRRMLEKRLKVHKDVTLAEATATAHTIMEIEGLVPLECCRLIKYDDFHDSLESSFDASDDTPIGELLGGVKSSYKFDLLLEIRKPQEKFQEYKPGGTTIKAHIVDLEREEVAVHPLTIRCYLTNTVDEMRSQIAQTLGIDGSNMRIIFEVYGNETKLLDDPNKTLNEEGFRKSSKVFVEFKDVEDAQKLYIHSKLFKVLDCYANTICILVALPKVDKAILERLRVQKNNSESLYDSSSDDEKEEYNIASSIVTGVGRGKPISSNTSHKNSSVLDANTNGSESTWPENGKFTSSNNEIKKPVLPITDIIATLDDPFQDYDEGLGDSEIGDSVSSNGYQNSQTIHSDQSEDSSLTDSERTLVGDELSPRNNSPDIMGTEMEQDLEPLQHAGIEVSKPECDSILSHSETNCLLNGQDIQNVSSPEENTKDSKCDQSCCKNMCLCSTQIPAPELSMKCYFRAWPYTDYETGERMLRVYVDQRISLDAVKKELEPHVGVSSEYFKIYRIYSNSQEIECTKLVDCVVDNSKVTVKLGRSLRKGEYKVKIYQLCINETEIFKYLIDWVIVKGMTVLKLKKEILPEIKERCGLDIPLNRCRLRKKSWKNPGAVFLDQHRFDKDIAVHTNWELFLEVLPDAEPVTSIDQFVIFTRRWHPSRFQLDPLVEIVLDNDHVETLKNKLFEISHIPQEFIEYAKGQGSFPCETSLLSIHTDLEWRSEHTILNTWPLCIGDDGHVIYYRDKREQLKRLTEEEKREITNKENARLNKVRKSACAPRKEKALKIYTLDSSPNSTTNNLPVNATDSLQPVIPDLD